MDAPGSNGDDRQGTKYPGLRVLMLEQRDLKKDLLALGLLALAAFLAAALVSYDPGDPPSKLVYPERADVINVCGRSGAFVSRYLFTALGLGAITSYFPSACSMSCSWRAGPWRSPLPGSAAG